MNVSLIRRVIVGTATVAVATASLVAAGDVAQADPTVPAGEGGTVYAWGSGILGQAALPSALDGKSVVSVSGGFDEDTDKAFALALTSQGKLVAWGDDSLGQTDVPSSLDDKTVEQIAAGEAHSLALTSEGKVVAWGADPVSLGDTTVPTALAATTVKLIDADEYSSIAVTTDNKVVPFGAVATAAPVPTELDGKTITDVATGEVHALALTSEGKVIAWGDNGFGQSTVPSSLSGKTVVQITATLATSAALTSDGKVTVWGDGAASLAPPDSVDALDIVRTGFFGGGMWGLTPDHQLVAWGPGAATVIPFPAGITGLDVVGVTGSYETLLAIVHPRFDLSSQIDGTALVGSPLTASIGGTTPTPTSLSYQWRAVKPDNSSVVVGTDSSTYTPTTNDIGKTITVKITASGPGLTTTSKTSLPTLPVEGVKATLTGPAVVGTSLSPTAIVYPADANLSYQWTIGGVDGSTDSSIVPGAADVGATVSVTVTAKVGGNTVGSSTAGPLTIQAGTFTAGPTASISGSAAVGSTLTASAGTTTSPSAESFTYRWFADGLLFASGDDLFQVALTNAQAGSKITVEITAHKSGFGDVKDLSDPTAAVTGGAFVGVHASITGTPRVDNLLIGSAGTIEPDGAMVTYAWKSGADVLATTADWTPSGADAGKSVTLTVSVAKDGLTTVTDTSDPVTIANATFSTGVTASLSGTVQVGQVLAASGGLPVPAPTSYSYRWFSDGVLIDGATDQTFTPTNTQKHHAITVEVTAHRLGYTDSVDVSDSSGDVATSSAPDLTLTASSTALRLGETTTLTWSSLDADNVVASGDWSGAQDPSGHLDVTPTHAGSQTFILSASNTHGTTPAQVTVVTTLAPKTLNIQTNEKRRPGTLLKVNVGGLAPGESYTIRLGGQERRRGAANENGHIHISLPVPHAFRAGQTRTLTVLGSVRDRIGQAKIKIVN